MALLDMASSQSSFHNHFCPSRLQILRHGITSVKLTFRKEKRLPYIPRKVNFEIGHFKMRATLLIKAVATLEPKYLVQSDGHRNDLTSSLVPDSNPQVSQYPSEDSAETTEKERLRRMRISKAKKGNVAWNKGRKHNPDVRQLIAERTKLAMQNPKVKWKLVNSKHAQSDETKLKIGVGVRVGWERRRAKIKVQELCHFEWQNSIAEASRKGYAGQDGMQWNSYEVLRKQLEQEWLESIEWRRSNPKPKGGSRRVPKSPEQRKKISEAIAAKWADPDYRERVSVAVAARWADPDFRERFCAAISRYHGTPSIAERSPKRKPKDYRGRLNSRGTCKRLSTKLMALKWKNLIAEAARIGYVGQEELQWNSDNVFSKQLEQEWLESIERRRSNPKPKGGSRSVPKSPEHRKKISEAIAAKWADPDYRERVSVAVAARWADPDYRERVSAAISRHHGTQTIAERSPKRKPKDYHGRWNSRGTCKRHSTKLMALKWKNLIAEAARIGYVGQEELQWNSDDVLRKQLEQEWLESIERRRSNPKPKGGSRRVPKSPEQRKKISEAIAAKWADPDYRERVSVAVAARWADPDYRERVSAAISRHHGTPTIAERSPKRKPKDYRGRWNSRGTCKRRSTKLMALKWKNLIAEAARIGYVGQEELQWNSDDVFSKQLEQECLEIKSIELSGSKPKPKGSEP